MNRSQPLCALALAVLTLSATATPTGYTLVDLGASQLPMAINDDGTIVGRTYDTDVAEVYRNGQWQVLPNQGQGSQAQAIDAKGVIVGEDGSDAMRWKGGKRVPLHGISTGTAEGISNNGTIVGTRRQGGSNGCYAWRNAVITDLGTLGGTGCRAHAIDSKGLFIRGESYVPPGTGEDHAFIYNGGVMHDLGVLPNGHYSWVRSINRHGHASVWADTDNSGDWAAAYWNGTQLVQVPGINANGVEGFGGAMNDNDEMLAGGQDLQGHILFLYEGNTGTVTPIEPLIHNMAGWSFFFSGSQNIEGINDGGTIVGGATFNGVQHGFMLVPDAQ